jgi:dynein heavy chain
MATKKDLFKENKFGLIPSLSTVLLQEMSRFNLLLSVMLSSLKNLQKAIQGIIVMDQELDKMYVSMQNNQVPTNWDKVAYPSLKPLASWYRDLLERVAVLEDWLMNGNPNCFWMSGFFFPQGFMTGVL